MTSSFEHTSARRRPVASSSSDLDRAVVERDSIAGRRISAAWEKLPDRATRGLARALTRRRICQISSGRGDGARGTSTPLCRR